MSADLPAGFAPLTDAPVLRDTDVVTAYEKFLPGVVVTFSESLMVPTSTGVKAENRLYLFTHAKHPGKRFGLWSTGVLDRLMRQVKPGDQLYLRYEGKHPNPRFAEGTVHAWTAAKSASAPAAVAELDPDAPSVGAAAEFTFD